MAHGTGRHARGKTHHKRDLSLFRFVAVTGDAQVSFSALWPGAFALSWMLLVPVALSLIATALGVAKSSEQRAWWLETRDAYAHLRAAPWTEKGALLQRHVERLYDRMGYRIGKYNKEGEEHADGNDKGVDVIIECKPATMIAAWPFRGFALPQPVLGRLGIQCKNSVGKAGVEAIQEAFAGSPYWDCRLRYATAISPGDFTSEAIKFADKIGVNRIGTAQYEQAMGQFRPRGPLWPIGWPRFAQTTLLGLALVMASFCFGTFAFGRAALAGDAFLYMAAMIFVILSIRAAYALGDERIRKNASASAEPFVASEALQTALSA
jgi:hypothetical protein